MIRCSEDAERGLLGSILLDAERVMNLCRTSSYAITQHAFYVEAHRLVFRAVERLMAKGKSVDVLLVAEELERNGKLDAAGGRLYIDKLLDATPTPTHAEFYLQDVHGKWLLRELEAESKAALEDAQTSGEDAQVVVARHIQKMSELATVNKRDTKQEAWTLVRQQCENARNGILPGLLTPWSLFNNATGGAPYGMVTVMAGRCGTRKSYIANQWATHASVELKIPGAYFPLEDGTHAAMRRSACLLADVDAWAYMRGVVTDDECARVDAAADRLLKSSLAFCGGRGRSVDDIALEVARGVAKHGWRYVLVDAFKDIRAFGGDPSAGEVYKSGRLADVAERHNLATVVVHHIRKSIGDNRTQEDEDEKRIMAEDIRGRGEITDDARMVIIVQCKRRRNRVDGGLELYDFELDAVKNNHGPTGKVDLCLDVKTGRFTDVKKR